MAKLYNLARMSTTTTGTGTLTLINAIPSFLTFAQAGVQNGDTVTYAIEDGANREIGRGVYSSSGLTLTRSVLTSTNSNNPLSLSGQAQVFITAAAEDFAPAAGSFYMLGHGASQTVPADTNEAPLATVTVPSNSMGPNGALRITTMWAFTSSANAKTMRVYFGGLAGTKYLDLPVATNTVVFNASFTLIFNQGATNSQQGSPAVTPPAQLGAGTGASVTSSIDTTTDQTVVITGQKASAGETLKLIGYTVEIAYGA